MILDEFFHRLVDFFRKNRKAKSQDDEVDYSIKDVNIKISSIPRSVFLVIKKYGWVVFSHKSANFVRLTSAKYFKKGKNLYFSAVSSFKRDGLKKMLLRSSNYVFYGKGVLSRRELLQRKKLREEKWSVSAGDVLSQMDYFPQDGKERILLVSHDATKTGAPILVLHIAKTLKTEFGKEVVILLIQGGPLEEEFKKYGVVVNLFHQSFSSMTNKEWIVAEGVFEKLAGLGVKTCISNTVLSGMLLPFAKKYGLSCVSLIHEQSTTIKDNNFVEATEKLLQYSDKLVFSADFVKEDFAKNFKKFDREILVRPQGVFLKNTFEDEKAVARKILRRRLELAPDAKIILGAGFGNLRKGVDLFFEVVRQVTEKSRELGVYFVWMGEWDCSLRDKLIKKAEKNGFLDRIILVGFENDPSVFFAGADVFLLPSRQDPFPSVVLNAMDCGTPVVAFAGGGGAPEILINQRGGIVPFENTVSMKEAVLKLLTDDDFYQTASEEAKKAIENKFVFKDYAEFLLEQLKEVKKEKSEGAEGLSMENEKIDVSVVFLTYNGLSDHFEETLEMVRKQKTRNSVEIIVIDSGSKDGTVEFVKKQKDIRLHEIPNSEFGHGKTRQLGAELAQGDFVVFLTQDATPANDLWLQELVDNFMDADVVGVCSRVIPRESACLLKKIEVNNDLSGRTKKIVAKIEDKNEFDKLSFSEKRAQYYFFNDVSSCVRRSYAIEKPFPDVPFAEDVEFAKIALRNGKKIVFEPSSVVCHSHDYAMKQTYKRNYVDAEYHREYLKKITVPTYKVALKNIVFCVGRDLMELKKCNASLFNKALSLLYSPIIHSAEQLGQFSGATQYKRIKLERKRLLLSGDLTEKDKQLLKKISIKIHPEDGMYLPTEGAGHYFSVGLSAIRCIDNILKKIGDRKPIASILDFPCGYGRVSRFIKVMFPKAQMTVAEIDPEMVNFCKREFSAQGFLSKEDISELNFPGEFDLIWCGSLFTHIDEQRAKDLLKFFQSKLSPGGLCVFTTHGQLSVNWLKENKITYGLSEKARELLLSDLQKNGYGYSDYDHQAGYGISVVSREHLLKMADSVGQWKEVAFLEHGWDNHQDVHGFVKF